MSSKNKRLAIGIGAGLVVLVLVLILGLIDVGGGKQASREKVMADIEANNFDLSQVDDALLADLLSYRFAPGKAYWFSFKRTVRATLKDQQLLDMDLAGQLAAHILEEQSRVLTAIVVVDFNNIKGVAINAGNKEEAAKSLAALVQFTRNGSVQALRFTPASTSAERDLMRDIVASWMQALPTLREDQKGPGRGSLLSRMFGGDRRGPFQIRGMDTQGEFLADLFVSKGEAVTLILESAKQQYLQTVSPVSIRESKARLDFDLQKGFPLERTMNEEFESGPDSFRLLSQQTFSSTFTKAGDSAYSLSEMALYSVVGRVFDLDHYRAEAAKMPNVAIKSWPDLKQMLADIKPDTQGSVKHNAFHQLTKTLKTDTAAQKAALQEVRKYSSETDQFQMLVGALSFSGSPEVQAGLIELFTGAGLDSRGRLNLLEAFTMMEQPTTEEARAFLVDTFGKAETPEIENSSGLALAAALRHKPDDKLRRTIEREWEKAGSPSRKRFVLEMIGNSGDDSFFGIVQEAYRSGNLFLQIAALKALRFMNSARARTMLLAELSGAGPELAHAAADAISHQEWKPTFEKPIQDCVRQRQNSNTRITCANYALSQESQSAGMKAVLAGLRGKVSDDFDAFIRQQLSQ